MSLCCLHMPYIPKSHEIYLICLCFQSVTPDEDSILDEDSDRWNGSPQGKRLEKEWAALSQCRALKRSSEVT